VIGFLVAMKRRIARPLFAAIAIAIACTIVVASMPIDWDGASSLGARRLVVLLPLFALLATPAVAPVVRWIGARQWRMRAALGGAFFAMLGLAFVGAGLVTVRGKINYDRPLAQAEQYGDGAGAFWAQIDENVGGLAILPAQRAFAWRYGLPKRSYYRALEIDWFDREYRTLVVRKNHLDFGEALARGLTTGFVKVEGGGARLNESRGTIVFTPSWPYVTHFVVRATAARKSTLAIASRTFFGTTTPIAQIDLAAEIESAPRVAVPAGAYDSGVNELVLTGDATAEIVVKRIELYDDGEYAPAFQ
jgi:hypothetical protein